MSVYTTELRYYIESMSPDDIQGNIDAMCLNAAPHIFTSSHAMWGGENDREELHSSILKHFYFREIGFETVALWKFFLNRKMMEIMPRYVELYNTTSYEYDLMNPISFRESYDEHGESTGHNEVERADTSGINRQFANTSEHSASTDTSSEDSNTSESNGKAIESDLPQATFAAKIDYASRSQTNANDSTATTTHSGTEGTVAHDSNSGDDGEQSESSGSEIGTQTNTYDTNRIFTREGNLGITGPSLVQEARDIIINIPIMIFDDLEELFMSLW